MAQKSCSAKPATSVDTRRVQQLVDRTKRNPLDTMASSTTKTPEIELLPWTERHTAASTLLFEAKAKIKAPLYVHITDKTFGTKHLTAYQKTGSAETFFVVREQDHEDGDGCKVSGAVKYISAASVGYLCNKKKDIKDFVEAVRRQAKKAVASSSSSTPSTPVKKTAPPTTPPPAPKKKPATKSRTTADAAPIDMDIVQKEPATEHFKVRVFTANDLTIERLESLLESSPLTQRHCGKGREAIVHECTTDEEMVGMVNEAAASSGTVILFAQPVQKSKLQPRKRISATPPSSSPEKASTNKKRRAAQADPGPSNVKRRRTAE